MYTGPTCGLHGDGDGNGEMPAAFVLRVPGRKVKNMDGWTRNKGLDCGSIVTLILISQYYGGCLSTPMCMLLKQRSGKAVSFHPLLLNFMECCRYITAPASGSNLLPESSLITRRPMSHALHYAIRIKHCCSSCCSSVRGQRSRYSLCCAPRRVSGASRKSSRTYAEDCQ